MPRLFPVLYLLCGLAAAALGCTSEKPNDARTPSSSTSASPQALIMNGGPHGGTFNAFADKMAEMITRDAPSLHVQVRRSNGSKDNLLALCSNRADMAIVNASDTFLGRTGALLCTNKKYADARSMAFLYRAPAQLMVRSDSGFHTVLDLRGKTIAVGNSGSGAALAAERFFRHLKLRGKLTVLHKGYDESFADLASGAVDGVWTLTSAPNTTIMKVARNQPVHLMNLHEAAVVSGFYQLYPFYSRATIPAGTYVGQDDPVQTFQDAALWCARAGLDAQAVYDSLEAVFTQPRLDELRALHGAAQDMGPQTAVNNLPIPLHPGAVRFWAERGVPIPSILMP